MDVSAASWAELARRVQLGDRDAEAEIARLFHQRVLMLASVRLHGSDAAHDIAQETILAVIEALRAGRLREPDRLAAFVLTIARNRISDHHRKNARRLEVHADAIDPPATGEGSAAAIEDERIALVMKVLDRLAPLDRRILLLTLVEGMTPREIAPIVGLKPDLVRTRKARAVRAVVEELAGMTRIRPPNDIGMSGPTPGGGR